MNRSDPSLKNTQSDLTRPICVLCPRANTDIAKHRDDEYYQDGDIQEQGFFDAIRQWEASGNGRSHHVVIPGVRQGQTGEQLVKLLQFYYALGVRYFIMTMSENLTNVKERFIEWRKTCDIDDAPVLIATIASAPGLARIADGIVRYYVRTEEEAKTLGEFCREKEKCACAISFYLDNPYGKATSKLFLETVRNKSDVAAPNCENPVTADDAAEIVNIWFKEYYPAFQRQEIPDLMQRTAILVAGYGRMLRETLSALSLKYAEKSGGFKIIACTSTLTQAAWQPKPSEMDRIIFTVRPNQARGGSPGGGGLDRDLVYHFAKRTLLRVLAMAKDAKSTKAFLDRWSLGQFPEEDDSALDESVESITGDIAIKVEVINNTRWRHKDSGSGAPMRPRRLSKDSAARPK